MQATATATQTLYGLLSGLQLADGEDPSAVISQVAAESLEDSGVALLGVRPGDDKPVLFKAKADAEGLKSRYAALGDYPVLSVAAFTLPVDTTPPADAPWVGPHVVSWGADVGVDLFHGVFGSYAHAKRELRKQGADTPAWAWEAGSPPPLAHPTDVDEFEHFSVTPGEFRGKRWCPPLTRPGTPSSNPPPAVTVLNALPPP